MPTRRSLAVELSRLKVFEKASESDEQYPTDSETAAFLLWNAYMLGDIKNKIIADLGAGTGILGIGALLLGAKKAIFVEKDSEAVRVLKENLKGFEGFQINFCDIKDFKIKVSTVIMNPPFGTRNRGADREFLLKAFEISKVVYSMHLKGSESFLKNVCADNSKEITHLWNYKLQLKQSLKHHKKLIHRVPIILARIE